MARKVIAIPERMQMKAPMSRLMAIIMMLSPADMVIMKIANPAIERIPPINLMLGLENLGTEYAAADMRPPIAAIAGPTDTDV